MEYTTLHRMRRLCVTPCRASRTWHACRTGVRCTPYVITGNVCDVSIHQECRNVTHRSAAPVSPAVSSHVLLPCQGKLDEAVQAYGEAAAHWQGQAVIAYGRLVVAVGRRAARGLIWCAPCRTRLCPFAVPWSLACVRI